MTPAFSEQGGGGVRLLAGAAIWTAMALGAWQGSLFLAAAIAARVLGPSDFGELTLLTGLVTAGGGVAATALSNAAIRNVTDSSADKAGAARHVLLVAAAIGLSLTLVVLAAWPILGRVPGFNGQPIAVGLLVGAAMAGSIVNGAATGSLIGVGGFRWNAISNGTAGVVAVAAMYPVVLHYGVLGALSLQAIAAWLMAGMTFLGASRHLHLFSVRAYIAAAGTHKHVSRLHVVPALVSGLAVAPALWLTSVIVSSGNGGLDAVGEFGVVVRLFGVAVLGSAAIGQPLLRALANRSEDEAVKTLNLYAGLLVATIPLLWLALFPESVLRIFGQGFVSADVASAVAVAMLASAIMLYREGISRQLVIADALWAGALSNWIWLVVLLAVTAFLRNQGAVGGSIGLLAAYWASSVVFLPIYVRKGIVQARDLLRTEGLAPLVAISAGVIATACNASVGAKAALLLLGGVAVCLQVVRLVRRTRAPGVAVSTSRQA